MDPRAPPEGAPGDFLEISSIDKIADKTNNRLLFLTVEYVEDQSRMFPSFEPVPFSSRASSPLSDFEHRVSPQDPNMSSAARYSPTLVQLPPSPFQNSVVVLQGSPPSPLISNPESSARTNVNYIAQLADQSTLQNIPQGGGAENFVDEANEEALVSCVEGELILMQASNHELAPETAPLMLAGDFLVMHDEHLNVVNSFKNQKLNHGVTVSEMPGKIKDCSPIVAVEAKEDTAPFASVKLKEQEKSSRRSKGKPFWCNECDGVCVDVNGCTAHKVRTIADQPVPARAIATLPGTHLEIHKLPSCNVLEGGFEYAIFAKRLIQKHTQFGPVEGVLCEYNGAPFTFSLPLLVKKENGQLMKVDVSNENTSNWMRFVRPAFTCEEQNLVICQQNDSIVFLTIRDIRPKEELRAGPHPDYARSRNLAALLEDSKGLNKNLNWSCFKCKKQFSTSEKLRKHLNSHENLKSNGKLKNRDKEDSSSKLFKVVDGQTLLYTCSHCLKVFPRSYSLKRHLLIHPGSKIPRYDCFVCSESFLNPHTRNRHVKMCHSASTKENRQNASEYKCLHCSMVFRKLSLLRVHKLAHLTGKAAETEAKLLVCPECVVAFEKRSELITHVAQHAILAKHVVAPHKCPECYKRFATKIRLQQHRLVHGAEDLKPLPCDSCPKRFMNNSALSCHLKTHKKEKPTFECPMCKKLFVQILELKQHIETHRNDDETFDCPHCSKTFPKYSVIRKHIRAHHCERTHKCHFCAKRFATFDKLRMHLLRHSDFKQFQCANCEKRFKRKDKLKEHMTRMHAERANKDMSGNRTKKKINPTDYSMFVYKCHHCLVGFKRRGMFVNHLFKRHPEVPFNSVPELNQPLLRQSREYYCQYCDKVYKSSSKRKAHIMKNHPGAALPPNRRKEIDVPGLPNPTFSQTVGSVTTAPQNCQWCHKQYASKAKLLQHQRKNHPSLMEPAYQIPRPRNRPPLNQNQPPLINGNAFIVADIQSCELDAVGQQFGRMRDVR